MVGAIGLEREGLLFNSRDRLKSLVVKKCKGNQKQPAYGALPPREMLWIIKVSCCNKRGFSHHFKNMYCIYSVLP